MTQLIEPLPLELVLAPVFAALTDEYAKAEMAAAAAIELEACDVVSIA